MGDIVLTYIAQNPGKTTAEIVSELQLDGAVAACISRLMQAGLTERA